MSGPVLTPVSDLAPGDRVDMEGDPYYGTITGEDDHDSCIAAAEFELFEICGVEQETPTCIRVDFEGHCGVGWPLDHRVPAIIDEEARKEYG